MSRYLVILLAICALVLPAAAAERKFDPDACAKAVAPYLDERTVAVLHVDLTAVDVDAIAGKVAELSNVDADVLPFPRKETVAALKWLTDAGVRDLYVVFSLADVPEHPPLVVLPLEKGADVKQLTAVLRPAGPADLHSYRPFWEPYHYETIGDALVGGGEATLQRLRDLKPFAPPDLVKAFAATGGGTAQLVVVPPKDAAKIIEGVMPTLPAEVGGGSSKMLTHGFRWAAVSLDASKPNLKLTIQAADADAAKAFLDLFKKAYAAAGKSKDLRETFPDYDKLTELLTPNVVDDRLELTLDADALRPLATKAVEAAARAESENRLRQLALAAWNYESTYRNFPPAASYDKGDKALLSWRVHLLPYLGEEKLYKEFHLDEPWDGEHNRKLIARMPAVFRSTANPKLAADGKTTYLAPVGEATMFPPGRGVRLAEVTDGTANTIQFVHADDDQAVVWTKPEDLQYDAKEPWKGLGGRHAGGFLAAFVDGSVHFIPKTFGKESLRALFTRSGGEVVTPP